MRLPALLAVAGGPAAAQDTLQRLRDTGELRLGYRTDALPLSFVDDAGLPAGYTVEVCEEVGEKLRLALELDELALVFVPVTPEDGLAAVTEDRIDLLCGATTVTIERRETVDFSLPTFVDGAAVLMPAGSEANMTALAGQRIGVRAATTTEEALRRTLDEQEMAAEVVLFDDHVAGREAVTSGDIAAYFGDQTILIGLILTSGAPETFMLSDEMLTVEKQALAMPRGDDDFRLAVDRALSELYISGRMQEILVEALPGVEPGLALRSLFLIAPDLL
jgi:polar amino acid transport system substrate-binding protein